MTVHDCELHKRQQQYKIDLRNELFSDQMYIWVGNVRHLLVKNRAIWAMCWNCRWAANTSSEIGPLYCMYHKKHPENKGYVPKWCKDWDYYRPRHFDTPKQEWSESDMLEIKILGEIIDGLKD